MTPACLLEELTLLVLYLASWEEEPLPGHKVRRTWKGHVFKVLDALEDKGFLEQSRRAKSLHLTAEGIARARELERRWPRS